MSKILSNLTKKDGIPKKAKRVGRGYGSTKGGHTATRGMKGQKSRSGGKTRVWFEGGQTPLVRRLPYRKGFNNPNKKDVVAVNFYDLVAVINETDKITPELLMDSGVIEAGLYDEIKILSKGEITKKVEFSGFTYSKKAKEKIEKAGGKAQ